MKDVFFNQKKVKNEKLPELILKDALNYDSITILCLGKYSKNLSPFLTFATKVGTILKANQFSVYGEDENSILIDNESIVPVLNEIKENFPNTFILVVLNSLSDSKKLLENLYYENTPFSHDGLEIGNANLKLCGSFGTDDISYKENSLSLEEINNLACDVAFLLMKTINEFKEEKESLTKSISLD